MEHADMGEARYQVTLAAETVGLPVRQVRRYIMIGLVPATPVERGEMFLDEQGLARLRKIRRLSADVGLNTIGIEVALHLLDQIDALQSELDRRRSSPEIS